MQGQILEKEGHVPKRLQDEVDEISGSLNNNPAVAQSSSKVTRNIVTVYNQDTYEIGKIRVNRVITIRTLMAKIATHFNFQDPKDIVIRLGDLNLVFDANSGDSELDKRLFSDLQQFSEANLIGIQILNNE